MSKTITTRTATARRLTINPALIRVKLGDTYRDITEEQAVRLADRLVDLVETRERGC